ncbi:MULTISPECIES: glycosyltransferase family 9 protein [Pseudomonas]|uniref:glycosyltransferase family 9 protein n=1 Tax=Pseudomonas TaxID=286 RepID=UPI00031BE3BC|nr:MULTISPECIES: glycosyltransferase family 9 protein [Pseudomonas]MBA1210462.1 glycosyltransferase family 9 protein [Pseudomonas psychrotolerans]TCQ83087.1 ADP-heptose:LPS heptosyltransferase [Pseudomonas sp. JUb52]
MSNFKNSRKAIVRRLMRCLVDRQLAPRDFAQPLHVVVPRWDAKLGDAIISSFFFREIRKLGARVTVLTVRELVDLHRLDFGVDRVIPVTCAPTLTRMGPLVRELGPVDVFVHLVGRIQPIEMLFIRLIRPARVYSLDDALHCVNGKLGEATMQLNVVERYTRVLLDLGATRINHDYIVPLPEQWSGSSVADILVNPYASRPDKSLSFSRALSLVRALADVWPQHQIGILCSPASRAEAQQLERDIARSNVRALFELDTPRAVAGAIHRAQVVVSVDTSIVHIAVGLKAALVAIYPAGNSSNPWLPPPAPHTRVVFCRHEPRQYLYAGVKKINEFNDLDVIQSVTELLGEPTAATLILDADIISGLGVATGTLARQLPLISRSFPEVAECHPGTLNLQLSRPLRLIHPHHRSKPLAWTPSGRTREVFDLLRIELEFDHFAQRVPAWLYVAHGSPHRQNLMVHEVIATRLELAGAKRCRMHLPAHAVSLA